MTGARPDGGLKTSIWLLRARVLYTIEEPSMIPASDDHHDIRTGIVIKATKEATQRPIRTSESKESLMHVSQQGPKLAAMVPSIST
jgi:hypothetical protein